MRSMEAKHKAYLAAAAAAAILIALFAATLYRPPRSGVEVRPEELPKLFVEAAQGLNRSTLLLNQSVMGAKVSDKPLAEEMERVSRLLAWAAVNGSLGEGELAERLRASSAAYSRLAAAAAQMEALAETLSRISGPAGEMLSLAENCNITGARAAAEKLAPLLREARARAKEVLDTLSGVEEDSLLSPGHRAIYRGAYGSALRAYLMLGELEKVADLLLSGDPGTLEKLCVAARCGGCTPGVAPGDLAQRLSRLNPGDAWAYGYQVSRIKSWLTALTGQQGGSQQGGQGAGAGSGGPSGED